MPLPRRCFLLLPALGAAACSVLPSRPYREVQRYALAPERPRREPPPRRGPVLLLRSVRAAPGMDARGLRVVGAGGQVDTEFYNEWAAPPVELVEETMRQWLAASGLFSAVVSPGSRLRPGLVLESELLRLQAELVAMQQWVVARGERLVIVMEGRDAAGKGSAIKRITQYLNPRTCRVEALPAPTEREQGQWYFQRYVEKLPSAGEIDLSTYSDVLKSTEDGGQGFLTFIRNSFLVAVGTVALTLLIAIPGAYAVARLEFFGRRQVSAVFLGVYFFPAILLAIPLFVFFTRIGQRGTLTGLLVVYVAQVAAVSIYMLRNYFDTIPASLEEAAAIDGCSRLQAMRHISLPLALPAIASNALFVFMIAWNEFLFALLFLVERRDNWTVSLGSNSSCPRTP